jgi:flagellar hook protein FlgE
MNRTPTSPVASRSPWRNAWLLPTLACLLAACGGGGGDGGGGGADDDVAAEPLLAAPGRTTVQQTDRALDLAIFGDGMFPFIDAQGRMVYSRTARLGLDLQNRLVNADGAWLAGEPEGKSTPSQPQALAAVPMSLPARASSTVRVEVNLEACIPAPAKAVASASQAVAAPRQFVQGSSGLNPGPLSPLIVLSNPWRVCPADPTPFATGLYVGAEFTTGIGIYDADGRQRFLALYFRDMGDDAWEVYAMVEGGQVWAPDAEGQPVGVLRFDASNGTLDPTTARWTVAVPAHAEGPGGAPALVEIDLSGSTHFAGPFRMTTFAQDGYAPGALNQIVVDGDDLIRLRYDNGQEHIHGRMLLAQFSVADRLRAVGQSGWLCEQQCAGPRFATPTTQLTGQVRSGFLESTIR